MQNRTFSNLALAFPARSRHRLPPLASQSTSKSTFLFCRPSTGRTPKALYYPRTRKSTLFCAVLLGAVVEIFVLGRARVFWEGLGFKQDEDMVEMPFLHF